MAAASAANWRAGLLSRSMEQRAATPSEQRMRRQLECPPWRHKGTMHLANPIVALRVPFAMLERHLHQSQPRTAPG